MNTNNKQVLTINTDGGARGNPGPAATGFVITTPAGEVLTEQGQVLGQTTNNTAEYQAVIHALTWITKNLKNTQDYHLNFLLDSNLVVNQVLGNFKIKEAHLQLLAAQIHTLLKQANTTYNFTYIPRAQNARADKLVNLALDSQ